MIEAGSSIAILGSGTLDAKELHKKLVEMGVAKGRLMLFGNKVGPWQIALEDEAADVFLPLEKNYLDQAKVVFLCDLARESRETVVEWVRDNEALLIDLSANMDRESGWADPLLPGEQLKNYGLEYILPEPEALYLAYLLKAIPRESLASVDCHLFIPASQWGEAGIQELYNQSINLINFKDIPKDIFGRQVAFNLVPVQETGEGAFFAKQVRRFSGMDMRVTRVAVLTPVFHSMTLSAMIQVTDALEAEQALRRMIESTGTFRLVGDEAWPAPSEAVAMDTPVVGVRPLSETVLWLWLTYDNIRSGKVGLAARIFEQVGECA